jgi:hypothetical protein
MTLLELAGVLALLGVGVIVALLPAVAVGYLAVRAHFSEIPASRAQAVAVASFLSLGLLTFWLTLAYFGLALGQTLGNANLGSVIGGFLGVIGWIATMLTYGARMTRALVELQALMRPQTDTVHRQSRLRNWVIIIAILSPLFVILVIVIGLAQRTGP